MIRVTLTIPGTGRGFGTNHADPHAAAQYVFTFCRTYAQKMMSPDEMLKIIDACGEDIDALIVAMEDYVGIEMNAIEEDE